MQTKTRPRSDLAVVDQPELDPRRCPLCPRDFANGPALNQHLRQKHRVKMVLTRGEDIWPPVDERDELLKMPTPQQVAFAQRSILDIFKAAGGCVPEFFTLYAHGNGVQIVITSEGAVDRVPVEVHEIPTLKGRMQYMAERAKKLIG